MSLNDFDPKSEEAAVLNEFKRLHGEGYLAESISPYSNVTVTPDLLHPSGVPYGTRLIVRFGRNLPPLTVFDRFPVYTLDPFDECANRLYYSSEPLSPQDPLFNQVILEARQLLFHLRDCSFTIPRILDGQIVIVAAVLSVFYRPINSSNTAKTLVPTIGSFPVVYIQDALVKEIGEPVTTLSEDCLQIGALLYDHNNDLQSTLGGFLRSSGGELSVLSTGHSFSTSRTTVTLGSSSGPLVATGESTVFDCVDVPCSLTSEIVTIDVGIVPLTSDQRKCSIHVLKPVDFPTVRRHPDIIQKLGFNTERNLKASLEQFGILGFLRENPETAIGVTRKGRDATFGLLDNFHLAWTRSFVSMTRGGLVTYSTTMRDYKSTLLVSHVRHILPFSTVGDAGSAVFTSNGVLVGIVATTSGAITCVIPIEAITEHFGMELAFICECS
ncbi:hypothetical protein RCL1_003259 [Eukaryota sp. TZLM3-RCL]